MFIELDMEVTELNLRLKKTVKDFLEIGIDIPFVSFNSGFMDGFLNRYHDVFGFPDYGRRNRPNNEFLYELRKDDVLIVDGNGGNGKFDVALHFRGHNIGEGGGRCCQQDKPRQVIQGRHTKPLV